MKNTCREPGCSELRMKRPGNTSMYFPLCLDHQIKANLAKFREEVRKDTEGLEKMREAKKKTPVEKFYASSAWRNFGHYVLLYYSNDDLMVRCSTDPNLIYRVNDKRIAVGHYLKCDQHKATAFEFKNVAPQSVQQNIHFSGNMEEMAKWIERTHGEGTVEWLNRKKNETLHLDKVTLDQISKHYLNLFNEELKRRNLKNPWK